MVSLVSIIHVFREVKIRFHRSDLFPGPFPGFSDGSFIFTFFQCVTVRIEISALRRERCQTEQHVLRVVISNGELQPSRAQGHGSHGVTQLHLYKHRLCSPSILPVGHYCEMELHYLIFIRMLHQSLLDLSPCNHGSTEEIT